MSIITDALDEIQEVINQIGVIWPKLSEQDSTEKGQRAALLAERRKLLEQFDIIIDGALSHDTPSLNGVIQKLKDATKSAKAAEKSIGLGIQKIERITSFIDKVAKATSAIAEVLT